MKDDEIEVNGDCVEEAQSIDFAAERLRLEREALAVERERLAAARVHADARAQLARVSHPALLGISVLLLSLLCFAGGLLAGIAITESREQRRREDRLAQALRQIDDISGAKIGTNSVHRAAQSGMKVQSDAHPNVSVVVIQ